MPVSPSAPSASTCKPTARSIHLHYDTGQRFRFGNIALKQDFLSPELLARYPAAPVIPDNVNQPLKLQSDLGNSNYFSQVAVNAPPDASTATAPVDVTLEPGKNANTAPASVTAPTPVFAGKLARSSGAGFNPQAPPLRSSELGYSQIKSLIGFRVHDSRHRPDHRRIRHHHRLCPPE